MEQINHIPDLWCEAIPELEREFTVCCCQGTDKVILEGLNCVFGSIDAMVVWLDKKEVTLLLHGETLDLPAGLFVHDIQLYYVTFSFQKLNFLYASRWCHPPCLQ